ncbi:uncharacterized protein LOC142219720 [Haematobia irritans]|uniref:uncharacterized protein LOC142219720 n=1 Tax=Haematobia irritans TaxID=7368 RepID=UPI003F4FCF82
MNKIVFVLIVLSSSMIFAERPSWYPENSAELDAECMKKHPVSAEIIEKVRSFHLEDTPNMRALVYCGATSKNVYIPGEGFNSERFVEGMKESSKMNCNMDSVRNCADKHKNAESDEAIFFNVLKCVFDDINGICNKVV